jgi:hypothetical protein
MKQNIIVRLKKHLKKYSFIIKPYRWLKNIFTPYYLKKIVKPSFFYNTSHNHDTCCIILAGYKEFLWDITMSRIKNFVPQDIDICILSSGIYSDKLHGICKENQWSYLCTKRNSVALALNTAIDQFQAAKYIYKIDEDIFITKNFFHRTKECYERCKAESKYLPAFVSSLIPVNAFGHVRLLEKLSLEKEYERFFEKPKYLIGGIIESNPNTAKYFWGEKGSIPHIDDLDMIFAQQDFKFSVCPIRFSIGAILFERNTWKNMGYFNVDKSNGMGQDEVQLCSLAMTIAKTIIVSENTLVGHFSFHKPFGNSNTTDIMKEYFFLHPERFTIKSEENDSI